MENIVAPYSQQIKSGCCNVSVQGYVGIGRQGIAAVRVIDSGRHHPEAQLGIGGIVRPSYQAYIEFLVACLVGIGKVAVYFFPDASLFYGILYRYHLNGILPTGICGCKIICPEEK